ncbi:hypothetical protein [Streptomyces acidiscabies]|uniref:hypothetical protein n=1 Tax=Streptomyces acidiscabies TaxID=42234 RepID=UPI00073EFEED|nr:hypothetical protein [Streptomyces acidiscabies]GAQ58755.1 hypothetical protein a10_08651 [Streptomyces acidiscabies]
MFEGLFAQRHKIHISPAARDTRVQYVCTCGARGWTTPSTSEARRMGQKHVALAAERAKAKAAKTEANRIKFKI